MKVVVTGIAGFIGSRIAKRLLDSGHTVIGLDNLSTGRRDNIPENTQFLEVDLAVAPLDELLPGNVDAIMHLAGQSSGEISFDDPIRDLNMNVVGTLNLIKYALKIRCPKIIYASSMSVYGEPDNRASSEEHPCMPLSCYGVGKLASENYLNIYSTAFSVICLRMFNVYGVGQDFSNFRQGMVSIYLGQAWKDGKIIVKGSLDRFRDFIYIDDVVDFWVEALTIKEKGFKVLNIGTGVKTSVRSLLGQIEKYFEKIPVIIEAGTPGDQSGVYSDTRNMFSVFGPRKLVSLDEGLKKIVVRESYNI